MLGMRPSDWIVIVLLTFQAVLAASVATDAGTLGLPKVAIAWMGIANVGVGVLLNQLRRLGGGTGS